MSTDLSKRNQILADFDIEDGIGTINTPGKFEGEMLYVPYFWDMVMDGGGDTQYDGDTPIDYFEVTTDDIRLFPELDGTKRIAVWESDSGFVNSELDPEDIDSDWSEEGMSA